MEKIYSEEHNAYQLMTTRPEKVRFLLDFSKAVHFVVYKDMHFESIMN